MRMCGRTQCEAGPQPDFVLRILGELDQGFRGFPKKNKLLPLACYRIMKNSGNSLFCFSSELPWVHVSDKDDPGDRFHDWCRWAKAHSWESEWPRTAWGLSATLYSWANYWCPSPKTWSGQMAAMLISKNVGATPESASMRSKRYAAVSQVCLTQTMTQFRFLMWAHAKINCPPLV